MRTAPYARVGTTDQTCEMQLRELREYAAQRGWEIARDYVNTGWSGAKASRPELDRLLQDARVRASTPRWFGSWTAGAAASAARSPVPGGDPEPGRRTS